MACFPFVVGRLIATCKRGYRPAEAVNCKSRASKTQEKLARAPKEFRLSFFASQNKQVKKSIGIPRSRLLQFTARAIHWRMLQGKTLVERSTSFSFQSIIKNLGCWWVPVGMWAKCEHFPALRSKVGKAQPVGEADCPYIHGHSLHGGASAITLRAAKSSPARHCRSAPVL
jgi:hypothetical protein